MSNSPEQPWSDKPNAPQTPPEVHLLEKGIFAGILAGTILYGIVMALFFQCMAVLLDPANPLKRRTRWTLVVHTVAMFSFLTISMGIYRNELSITYINNREFPGDDTFPPGPSGYLGTLPAEASSIVSAAMVPLNQWLADGLLLHRCYVVYFESHRVTAFPCLMYLASIATGSMYIYQESLVVYDIVILTNWGTTYYSICVSLNVLLTLMIAARLILHRKNIREAMGASDPANGLYMAIITMLIESYALYAAALLLYTVPFAIGSWVVSIFSTNIAATQVIAPYLIILRVAKQKALTSESISGTVESIRFVSQGTADGDGTLPDGDPTNSTDVDGGAPGELGARAEDVIEEVPR